MRLLFSIISLFIISEFDGQYLKSLKKKAIDDGGIIYIVDGSKYVGQFITVTAPYQLLIATGDTLTIHVNHINRIHLPDEIQLFPGSKFHYKKGFQAEFSSAFGGTHAHFDYSLFYLFKKNFSLGIGMGFHNNSFFFSTANSNHFGNVFSIPYYARGNYYFSNRYFKPYVQGKIGYANNFRTFNVNSVVDGLQLECGLGISFTSKTRSKFYIEFSQYALHAKGTMTNNDPNGLGDIGFDIWFNRFIITTGFTFGK
jgi:hypothetical protein